MYVDSIETSERLGKILICIFLHRFLGHFKEHSILKYGIGMLLILRINIPYLTVFLKNS
jgi:hypothetical protein